MSFMTRRLICLGLLALPGCAAISTLNQAATPKATFELQAYDGTSTRRRSQHTLLVVGPEASAAIATDRILMKQDALSVTYLPDARWADEVPMMVQSILVQSIAASGYFGFVGVIGAGPVPDSVLLTRIDSFEAAIDANQRVTVRLAFDLTVLRDRDQKVLGTRRFSAQTFVSSDHADQIAQGFQQIMDETLPVIVTWAATTSGAR